jgi:hypothetical protein
MREKTFVERREHRELQQGSEARDAVPNRDDDQRRDCQPDYQQNKECDPLSRDDPLRRLLTISVCLPRHPAVAYLFLVSLGPGLSDEAYYSWQRRGRQKYDGASNHQR